LKRFVTESKNKDKINENNNDYKFINDNCNDGNNDDNDNVNNKNSNNSNNDNNNLNNDNNNNGTNDDISHRNDKNVLKLSDLQKLTYRMSLQLNLKPKLKFDIDEVDCDYLRTALHYACKHNHYDVVLFLMDQSCDLNLKDIHGRSALHFAAAYGMYSCIFFVNVCLRICR
jgi:ankyrin repeat protein